MIVISGCTSSQMGATQSWDGIHNGMTREEVYAMIGRSDYGEPERHFESSKSLAWESWAHENGNGKNVVLSLSYDTTGRVVSVSRITNSVAKMKQ